MMPPAMATALATSIEAAERGTTAAIRATAIIAAAMATPAIARPIRQAVVPPVAMLLTLVAELTQQMAGNGAAQRAQNPMSLLVA